jgi:hypothetical protein
VKAPARTMVAKTVLAEAQQKGEDDKKDNGNPTAATKTTNEKLEVEKLEGRQGSTRSHGSAK